MSNTICVDIFLEEKRGDNALSVWAGDLPYIPAKGTIIQIYDHPPYTVTEIIIDIYKDGDNLISIHVQKIPS